MKQLIKIVGSLILLIVLCLSVVSCVKNDADNDDWITGNVEIDQDSSYAKPAKDTDDGSAAQSSERTNLPLVPLD